MGTKSRFALLTLSLLTIPAGFAFAQNEVNDGSKSAKPPAHHSTAAKPSHHTATAKKSRSAADPNVPGATGETIVKGDNSTIAGDRKATREQKAGTMSQ